MGKNGTRVRAGAAAQKKPAGAPRKAAAGDGMAFGRHIEAKDHLEPATPAQIALAVREVIEQQSRLARESGRLGAIFKKWEDDCGIDRKRLRTTVAAFKLTEQEAMMDHAELTRMKVAVGILPPPADEKWTKTVKQTEMDLVPAKGDPAELLGATLARQHGFKAGLHGKAAEVNPYNASTMSNQHTAWQKGQSEGVVERTRLKPETANTRPANASRVAPVREPTSRETREATAKELNEQTETAGAA
jgi:hypothetical protein